MTLTYDIDKFHRQLVEHGLILPTQVKGAYGRGAVFEDIVRRFDDLVARIAAPDGAEQLSFPPILPRALVEKVGYLDNFPQLAGSVHSFAGNDAKARELSAHVNGGQRWEHLLDPTEVMLTPAACYPVYPNFSGLLPGGGRLITVLGWVFRHEPSDEPTRLQSFRMREFIRMGKPDEVLAWRDNWLQRGLDLLRGLDLPVQSDVASDPFFGRAGKMMAAQQVDQRLKFEIVVPIISLEKPTAICSFNWHQDHFSSKFGIRSSDDSIAHTACLGFGMERVTLALIKTHGFDPASWPDSVRRQLWP
ncbi:amino acid--[acyl-carrier-protein] ligase [Caenimonas soli]|uniref:amino acid--[acyl-carrier-protein] ligase n=1 Tax=Caenimonas soli TaxID=2735555 RepID=UPI0015536D87|nr:amino acid--[acyl-carrier-protein] ligase [Caenimonas soli]NPC57359.1 amino acid--[acyl-carrier-protein] ligase [Caenimonas soli]